ncbi:MAG: hypothetical protein Q9M24_02400 [Mariprofundaceae bacterium]|nr:hypothetical protein [Mariprofundaceae bacterium]
MLRHHVFLAFFTAILLCLTSLAKAETATIEVLHLPLQEASDVVKNQLSRQGTVARLPSRQMLIIQDDAGHIERARALLKRLDMPPPQLNVQVNVVEQETADKTVMKVSGVILPGGWMRIQANHEIRQGSNNQRFRLRVTSGKYGRIEAGNIRAVRPSVRYFLHRYGVADTPDLALVPITAGFDVRARLIGKSNVRLDIHPWFERERQETNIQADMEILPSLGSTASTKRPPATQAPIRLNMQPQQSSHIERIAVTNANTELTVRLGETVTLAATRQAAKAFGNALLDHYTTVANRSVFLRLTVTQADY